MCVAAKWQLRRPSTTLDEPHTFQYTLRLTSATTAAPADTYPYFQGAGRVEACGGGRGTNISPAGRNGMLTQTMATAH